MKNNRSSRYILWKKLSSSLGCTVLGIFYIFYTFYTSFETLLYFFGTLAARLFDLNVSSGESFSFSLSCSICSRPCQAHNESLFLIFASLFSDTLVMQYLRDALLKKRLFFYKVCIVLETSLQHKLKTSQELRMLSSVTLDCQVTKIVRFSIVRIVISVSIVTSLQDCLVSQGR